MTVLVTGAAGFIGFHASQALLARGERVIGVDCLTEYYDVRLKQARLAQLSSHDQFQFEHLDLANAAAVRSLFETARPTAVLHLAAQAGVRYSLHAPFAYTHANVNGHLSILEGVRALDGHVRHCVYASSSSVYGEREACPTGFKETDPVDAPVSLYAATKRADELMSATYTHLYGLPLTGLRFFTVYGPWGRPDMAYFSFAEKLLKGERLPLFNAGRNTRDFTYIADMITPLLRVLDDAPGARHDVFNIGGSSPETTLDLVAALERHLGVKAQTDLLPPQPGDVTHTCADTRKLTQAYGAAPVTGLDAGVGAFAEWFHSWKSQ